MIVKMRLRESVITQLIEKDGLSYLEDLKNRKALTKMLQTFIDDNGKYRKVVENIVLDLIEVFERHNCKYSTQACNAHAPVYPLYIAVFLCFKYGFSEGKIVSAVIQHIVDNTSDAGCWFNFLSPFGNLREVNLNTLYPFNVVRRVNQGLYVGEWITDSHLDALEYYLSHATTVKSDTLGRLLGMPSCSVRFTDLPIKHRYFGHVTPLTLACLTGHPKAVLLLLRYGSSPLYPAVYQYSPALQYEQGVRSPWIHPLHSLINQLNLRATDGEIDELPINNQDRARVSPVQLRQKRLLICLIYMLRVIAHPPVNISHDGQELLHKDMKNGAWLRAVYGKWIEQPFNMAPSLQHLCRCSVREALKRALQLPRGIQHLPVPDIVKRYIDLI